MILATLSLLFRSDAIALNHGDEELVDREAPRARNHVLARMLKRARGQIWIAVRALLMVVVGWLLDWTAAAILSFMIFNALLSVALDLMRYSLASRWIHYSHARDFRAEEILLTCRAIEHHAKYRNGSRLRPQPLQTLIAACAASLVVIVGAGLASYLGWFSWRDILSNWLFPFLIIAMTIWRTARALRWTLIVRTTNVGASELMLESDDALDVYAGLVALSWLVMLLGSSALAVIALAIAAIRLGYRAYRWWWLRDSVNVLTTRLERLHPHVNPAIPAPEPIADELDFSEAELRESGK